MLMASKVSTVTGMYNLTCCVRSTQQTYLHRTNFIIDRYNYLCIIRVS